MIKLGDYNKLSILRNTTVGLYLGNGEDEILLPKKYIPKRFEINEVLEVFVYLDHEERLVATTLKPYVKVNEFAHLQVNHTNNIGAFLNWGLEKDVLAPFKEQAKPMEKGNRYLVYVYVDEKSNRIIASSRISKYISDKPENLSVNDEVHVMVSHINETGIHVIVNNKYKGLAYHNEIYEEIKPGNKKLAYIKNIREDGKIDISFKKLGADAIDADASLILNELKSNNGILYLTDNSHPEEIKTVLKLSKKAFKRAIGNLYKQKLITINQDNIQIV